MSFIIGNNLNILNKNFSQKKKKFFSDFLEDLKENIEKKDQFFFIFNKKYLTRSNTSLLKKLNKYKTIVFIGMGGSILGIKAFNSFLKKRNRKKIFFIDNLDGYKLSKIKKFVNSKTLFVIISKSGKTLETLTNLIVFKSFMKSNNSLIITEKSNNALYNLAKKKKYKLLLHEKFVGGRFSILSKSSLIPLKLLGLKKNITPEQFSKYLANKKIFKELCLQASKISNFYLDKKYKSIACLSYASELNDLIFWFQQLSAESLGKKGKGLMPFLSICPKDHHSLLQLYLDGPKDKIFYIFDKNEKPTKKVRNLYGKEYRFLDNKTINDIKKAQKNALIRSLKAKKIPYRLINFSNNDEKSLFDFFIYFILETIMVARLLDINPFNQPAVEEVKINTFKNLN